MLIDSHCHLDMLDLSVSGGSIEVVLENAASNGVSHLITIAVDLPSSGRTVALARAHKNVSATIGVHPSDVNMVVPSVDTLIELGKQKEVVAIGETGLDYHYNDAQLDEMRVSFRHHIQAAIALNKPLIIHSRDAREDTLKILKEEGADKVGGVMHCFTESLEMAQRAMELGFYISFSGIVTFKNAKNVQEVAKEIPLERMLVETDAPYLTPVPYRGKPNQPAYVRYVAEYLAQLRNEELDHLIEVTGNNCNRLFSLGLS